MSSGVSRVKNAYVYPVEKVNRSGAIDVKRGSDLHFKRILSAGRDRGGAGGRGSGRVGVFRGGRRRVIKCAYIRTLKDIVPPVVVVVACEPFVFSNRIQFGMRIILNRVSPPPPTNAFAWRIFFIFFLLTRPFFPCSFSFVTVYVIVSWRGLLFNLIFFPNNTNRSVHYIYIYQ